MLSRQDLEILSTVNIKDINKDELVELTEIDTDSDLSIEERFEFLLHKIKNPYCFLVNGNPVKIAFSNTERTLYDALKNYLINIKSLDE